MTRLEILKWLVGTNTGRVVASVLWTEIFLIVDDNIRASWAFYTAMVGIVMIVVSIIRIWRSF